MKTRISQLCLAALLLAADLAQAGDFKEYESDNPSNPPASEEANAIVVQTTTPQCRGTEPPWQCRNQVYLAEIVYAPAFDPKFRGRHIDDTSLFVRNLPGAGSAAGWVPLSAVVPLVADLKNKRKAKLQAWQGPKTMSVYAGHAMGEYKFRTNGTYVFRARTESTKEAKAVGQLRVDGNVVYVGHSLGGPTVMLLVENQGLCWFVGGGETLCAK